MVGWGGGGGGGAAVPGDLMAETKSVNLTQKFPDLVDLTLRPLHPPNPRVATRPLNHTPLCPLQDGGRLVKMAAVCPPGGAAP